MATRPIPLRAWQVSAALDDRLSVLVVALNPQPPERASLTRVNALGAFFREGVTTHLIYMTPSVGDRLWARETWNVFQSSRDGECSWPFGSIPKEDPRNDADARSQIVVDFPVGSPCAPGHDAGKGPWRPSIHMPRWASRLTLDVTEARVCRLHDVTEDEARAAGVNGGCTVCGCEDPCGCANPSPDHRDGLAGHWNEQHGRDAWFTNSWVAVARVEVHHRNIDSMTKAVSQHDEGSTPR